MMSWLIRSSNATERASRDQFSDLSMIQFFCKGSNYSVASFFLLLSWTPVHGKTGETYTTVNCYCYHSIISLHLCKEYLTVVIFKTPILLLMKCWIFW